MDDLKAEIAELRERLGQNPSNSSKPPSSDPPSYKPSPRREPQGRKRGGQPGHQGSTRKLSPAAEVDHLVELKPASCPACGRKSRGADPTPGRRQVSEVPPVKAEVTEYRRHALRCRGRGTLTLADWPAGVPPGAFGPRAQAVVGYLTGRLGASHRDVTEAMAVLYGLEVSVGSISAIQRRVSEALRAPVERACHFVRQQKSPHVDETGWRECGRLKWLWVNATRDVTAFEVLDGRGAAAARQVISPEAKGIVTTDRYWSYNWLACRRRQVCWAHLRRDFQAMVERGGESQEVGEALLKQAGRLFTLWHKARDGDLARGRLEAAMRPVRKRVKEALEAGARCGQQKTRRTCANILKVGRSLWTFLRTEGVEPTNNAAERSLRRAVLWRRKSFGTQSAEGSRFVGRVLTAVESLRQQGRDVPGYLAGVGRAALSGEAREGLIPQLSSTTEPSRSPAEGGAPRPLPESGGSEGSCPSLAKTAPCSNPCIWGATSPSTPPRAGTSSPTAARRRCSTPGGRSPKPCFTWRASGTRPPTPSAAMAEESGSATAAREAVLRLRLTAGEAVECLVDTGFTGALVLPQELVARLNLPIIGREVFEMNGGRRFVAGVALVEVEWLRQRRTFRVIVSEDTLLGTEMLDGCRVVIDYAAHTVSDEAS